MSDNPLGRTVDYPRRYSPDLLFSVERQQNREKIGLAKGRLPFTGYDLWHAFELSWLGPGGRPEVAIGEFRFPCESPRLVESKSLKLYLNSLNGESYSGPEAVRQVIEKDLSAAAGAGVEVRLCALRDYGRELAQPQGTCLDSLNIRNVATTPDPQLLQLADPDDGEIHENLYSDLFRSNCPITSQPDWGSVEIAYQGRPIDHAALLHYIVSYREHQGFHEDCAERIFQDLMQQCRPRTLRVAIYFLRRGGLDINPVRSTEQSGREEGALRLIRQ